ncbi:hypothetical protein Ahy_A05g023087 [Arachis hypogaea]|uniref:Mediator of RNA polymerase II transcription subunit 25 n=1 Tax=Arachis hypogaea TaxID=3818 RepID=A0A445D2V7_ARAHY|nr:hypothetical protein Ahy_A05g023087 [Arachis hypogaea]
MTINQNQKRLIIVVDGNAMLVQYWPTIISEYLEKIVRNFCDNSQEQENNTVHEVGLVIYTANKSKNTHGSDHIKFLDWTKDMETFLGTLPFFELTGDGSDKLLMTQGLIEAIMMFIRDPKHNDQKKHCVLVALCEPNPTKTLITLPVIEDGQFLGSIETINGDIFDVMQIFAMLNISFSVITPTVHPIFRAIFNKMVHAMLIITITVKANNVDEREIYVLGGRSGEISVLLSRNFIEAHSILQGSTSKNITNFIVQEPITVAAITHVTPDANSVSTTDLPVSEWQSSIAIATMLTGEQSLNAVSADHNESQVDVPNNATPTPVTQIEGHEEDYFSSSFFIDDMIDELIKNNNDDDEGIDGILSPTNDIPNSSVPLAVFSFEDLLNPNEETISCSSSKTKVSGKDFEEVDEHEFGQALRSTTTTNDEQHKNKSKDKAIMTDDSLTQVAASSMDVPSINIAPSPMMMSVGSSSRMGVPNPVLNSAISSSSNPAHHVLESSAVQAEVHDTSGGMLIPGIEAMFGINKNHSFTEPLVNTHHHNQYLSSSSSSPYYSLFPSSSSLGSSRTMHQLEQYPSSSSAIAPPITHMGHTSLLQFQDPYPSSSSAAALNPDYHFLGAANNNNNARIMGGNYSSPSMLFPFEPSPSLASENGGEGPHSIGYFTQLLRKQQQQATQAYYNNQHRRHMHAGPTTYHLPYSSSKDFNQYVIFTWEKISGSIFFY